MFGNQMVPRAFSFTKILGGISKTLNVANQLIPLYNQAKPIISNARNILGVLKEFNSKDSVSNKNIIESNDYQIKKEDNSSNSNNPTFFI